MDKNLKALSSFELILYYLSHYISCSSDCLMHVVLYFLKQINLWGPLLYIILNCLAWKLFVYQTPYAIFINDTNFFSIFISVTYKNSPGNNICWLESIKTIIHFQFLQRKRLTFLIYDAIYAKKRSPEKCIYANHGCNINMIFMKSLEVFT